MYLLTFWSNDCYRYQSFDPIHRLIQRFLGNSLNVASCCLFDNRSGRAKSYHTMARPPTKLSKGFAITFLRQNKFSIPSFEMQHINILFKSVVQL